MPKKRPAPKKVNVAPKVFFSGMAWVPLVLAIGAMALYAPSLRFEYVFDDDIYLAKNTVTQRGLSGWADLWGKGSAYGFSGENSGTYRPVTLLTFALEKSGRKPFDPARSHAINILLYSAALALWWLALWEWGGAPAALWSALGLALFAAHPIHVEVVANVKNREELLVLFFGALLVWAHARSLVKRRWLGMALAAYALACLSKENGVALLVAPGLALWFFRKKNPMECLRATAPYAGVLAACLLARWVVLDPGSALTPEDAFVNNAILAAPGTAGQLATTVAILGRYLLLLAGLHPMTYDYSYAQIEPVSWSEIAVWLSVAAYAALMGISIWGLRRKKPWAWGLGLFFASLAVVSQLWFQFEATMALRFLFLPSLGICLALAWAAGEWAGDHRLKKRTALVLLSIGVLVGAIGTASFLPVWRSNEVLFRQGAAVSPNSFRTHFNLAELTRATAELSNHPVTRREYFSDAVRAYRNSLAIYTKPASTWYNLGVSHMGLGELDQAAAAFRVALQQDPEYAVAANNLGVIYFQKNQPDSARAYFLRALAADPGLADGWANLGAAHYQLGEREAAILSLRRALEINPGQVNARNNLQLLEKN